MSGYFSRPLVEVADPQIREPSGTTLAYGGEAVVRG